MEQPFSILFLTIPRIVYDRSLNDRCTDFGETVQYIMNQYKDNPNIRVDLFDAAVPVSNLKTVYKALSQKYSLIVFFADVSDAPMACKLARILCYVSPQSRCMVYGDGTLAIPQFFTRRPFDAVHMGGDQEIAIHSYIEYLRHGKEEVLKGIAVHIGEEFKHFDTCERLPSEAWAFPPIAQLPIKEYHHYAKNYKNSVYACTVYTSKGCPNACEYCLCISREGLQDRRRPIEPLIEFLEQYKNDFTLFKFHSPNFLYDRRWVEEFCRRILQKQLKINWKITTSFDCMDADLVQLIWEAGCRGIGFGVETFYEGQKNGLKINEEKFAEVMSQIMDIPIKYKGYIMVGMENQTLSDIYYTIDLLKKYRVKPRPSAYTPFFMLKNMSCDELDKINLEAWDKKESFELMNKNISGEKAYEILSALNF